MSKSWSNRFFGRESWKIWAIAALALLLVWGSWERHSRGALQASLFAQNQRDFYEVLTELDSLAPILAKAEASNSPQQRAMLFTTAWRRAWGAQESLARIPLGDVNLGRTRQFLNQAGDFCYALAQKAMRGEGVTQQDRENLRSIRTQLAEISTRLHQIEPLLLRERFRSFQGGGLRAAVARRFWWMIPRESPPAIPRGSTSAGTPEDSAAHRQDSMPSAGVSIENHVPAAAPAPGGPAPDQPPAGADAGGAAQHVTARQRFREMNEFMEGQPTLIYDGPFSAHLEGRVPGGLAGPSVSEQAAQEICLEFLRRRPGDDGQYRVQGIRLVPGPFQSYAVALRRMTGSPDPRRAGMGAGPGRWGSESPPTTLTGDSPVGVPSGSPAIYDVRWIQWPPEIWPPARQLAPGPLYPGRALWGRPAGSVGDVMMGVARTGGKVLWMMDNSPAVGSPAAIGESDAARIAGEFLKSLGFEGMELTSSLREASSVAMSFVPVRDGVLIYPDQLKVAVSLDSGRVVAFDASQYYMAGPRKLPRPKLGPDEAKAKVSPALEVQGVRKALIPLPSGRDVLAYELKTRGPGGEFLIYINAETGTEEMILQLIKTPRGTLAV